MRIVKYIGLNLWMIGNSMVIGCCFVNDLTFNKFPIFVGGFVAIAVGIMLYILFDALEDYDEHI